MVGPSLYQDSGCLSTEDSRASREVKVAVGSAAGWWQGLHSFTPLSWGWLGCEERGKSRLSSRWVTRPLLSHAFLLRMAEFKKCGVRWQLAQQQADSQVKVTQYRSTYGKVRNPGTFWNRKALYKKKGKRGLQAGWERRGDNWSLT